MKEVKMILNIPQQISWLWASKTYKERSHRLAMCLVLKHKQDNLFQRHWILTANCTFHSPYPLYMAVDIWGGPSDFPVKFLNDCFLVISQKTFFTFPQKFRFTLPNYWMIFLNHLLLNLTSRYFLTSPSPAARPGPSAVYSLSHTHRICLYSSSAIRIQE